VISIVLVGLIEKPATGLGRFPTVRHPPIAVPLPVTDRERALDRQRPPPRRNDANGTFYFHYYISCPVPILQEGWSDGLTKGHASQGADHARNAKSPWRSQQSNRTTNGLSRIRADVDHADSRPELTELYKRAGYLITLTYSPAWEKTYGQSINGLRKVGQEEFRKTAKKINRKAKEIGTEADYDATWGSSR
jgi:hypothetical protein